MMYGMGNGWFMGFGWFFGIILVIAIVWFIVRSTNKNNNPTTYQPKNDKALDILKERYARGEINKEEFEEMKKDLQ